MLDIWPDLIEDGRVLITWPTWLTVAAYVSVGTALIAGNLMLLDVFVRGHYFRWPLYASVAVLGFESIVCFFLGSDEWTEQWTEGNVVGINSVHVRYAIELCTIGALNILASLVFLLRRWGWWWWLVAALQVGSLLLAEIEAQVIDPNAPGWPVFSRVPLVALVLLFAIQVAQGRLKSSVDRLAP